MSTPSHKLDDFRKKIDEIDIRLHDLILQRADIVEQIGREKGLSKTASYQPSREARLFRRILARPTGKMSKRAIFAIWRDLVTASIEMQGGLTLAVLKNAEDETARTLGLEHFSSDMDASYHGTPAQVLNAVSQGRAAIGLLPFDQGEQGPNWWHHLCRQDANPLRVVARLPFLASRPQSGSTAAKNEPNALIVAAFDVEQSDDDHSLFVLTGAQSASRALVRDATIKAGLPLAEHKFYAPEEEGGERLHLLDLEGYITGDDKRFEAFLAAFAEADATLLHVGGYATPLVMPGVIQGKDESE